jgi:hypothetical protein
MRKAVVVLVYFDCGFSADASMSDCLAGPGLRVDGKFTRRNGYKIHQLALYHFLSKSSTAIACSGLLWYVPISAPQGQLTAKQV